MKGLDAWITGNYGEDHPDNQPCCECGKTDSMNCGCHDCKICGNHLDDCTCEGE